MTTDPPHDGRVDTATYTGLQVIVQGVDGSGYPRNEHDDSECCRHDVPLQSQDAEYDKL